MRTLNEVAVGDRAVVKRIHGEGPLKRRIMDMGLTRGIGQAGGTAGGSHRT